ncbi:MAG: cell division protein ZapA [Rhizobiales bacterium]|nr:cell division protein ZapA [Hyphomicrobiales bacterium]
MAHVNVTINGRQYRMECEDGQEQHLEALAADFDKRIAGLHAQFSEMDDMRLTVMAALTLADELSETARKLAESTQERESLRQHGAATQTAVIAALNAASERIETVARGLHQTVNENSVPFG